MTRSICSLLALFVAVMLLAAPSSLAAEERPPTAKACAKIKAKANAATGAKKRKLTKAWKACKAKLQAGQQVMDAFVNGHYVGAREDGHEMDEIYCKNDSYIFDLGDKYEERGTGWWISNVRVVKQDLFFFVETKDQHSVAYRRVAGQWQVGISFNDGYGYGNVTRTDAGANC